MVWVHPKTVSSTTGALVGAGSLRPINWKGALELLHYTKVEAKTWKLRID
jgi:hypothetical protein